MKRLENIVLTAIIGSGLLVLGCGGSGDSSGTASDQPAASAPAEAAAPATEPAAAPEPAGMEPSEAGAIDEAQSEAPAQEPRRFVPPVRGVANIEILAPVTKVEGTDVVTRIKVRNVSRGSIALFTVSENWYDKAGTLMPGDSYKHRKPFLPGEVIDVELRTPKSSRFYQNQFQFSHANGNIDVKTVKSFPKGEGEGSAGS